MSFSKILSRDLNPSRPRQTTYAVYLLVAFLLLILLLYLASLVIGIVYLNTFDSSFIFVFVYAFMVFVVNKVADGENWARWLLLVGFALFSWMFFSTWREMNVISGGIILVLELLLLAAIVILFKNPSRAWYTGAYSIED